MKRVVPAHSNMFGLRVIGCALILAHVSSQEAWPQISGDREKAIEIGTRLELFVDHFLIEHLENAELKLHHPQIAPGTLKFDKPWEGAFSGYATLIKDGDIYRMYYRGLPTSGRDGTDSEVTCYAVSLDGIHWTKPNLRIHSVDGSLDNNIVIKGHTPASHNFSPFLDTNPNATIDQRYKALGGTSAGLIGFTSPDGINWVRVQQEPVFTKGLFDSQNVSFWSSHEQQYVCYFRTWTGDGFAGFRSVSRTTSKDFVNWTEPVQMTFGDTPMEHLYTNQTHPYFRAPHVYIAIAARFMPGRRVLSSQEAKRIKVDARYFGDCSDTVLMSSRGGDQYERTFMESFIRPGIGLENWVSRTNYTALGVVPTGEAEMSIYMSRNYGQPTAYLQRFVLRMDGFASIHAGYDRGRMLSKPLMFPKATEEELVDKRRSWEALVDDQSKSISPKLTSLKPIVGKQSLAISRPISLELSGTSNLGEQFTLAAHISSVPAGHRRLFSAYNGGSTVPRELVLDFDSGGNIGEDGALRFFYDDFKLNVDIEKIGVWSSESGDSAAHHIALTWNRGAAKLFFDGQLVAKSTQTKSDDSRTVVLEQGNLRFGEDIQPTSTTNEPLLGIVDDILLVRRALSGEQIREIFKSGAVSALPELMALRTGAADGQQQEYLLTMEDDQLPERMGEDPIRRDLTNSLSGGSVELPALPGIEFPRRELTLNMSTSAAGRIRVGIQDALGNPIPGFSLDDADEQIGDQIEHLVTWRGGSSDISELSGRPIRFHFELKDADVYSMKIQ